MTPTKQPSAQQFDLYKYLRVFWRRKWLFIIPLLVCLVGGIAIAAWLPVEYESYAVLETVLAGPGMADQMQPINAGREVRNIRQVMLSRAPVREVLLSHKVDMGEEINPDDDQQIQRLIRKVQRHTRISAASGRFLKVSFRSPKAERNALLVNELVKKYVGEDRDEATKRAKFDRNWFQERYDKAKMRLSEIEREIQQFQQNNPRLPETIPEAVRNYDDAIAREDALREQIDELEPVLADRKRKLTEADDELKGLDETIIVEVPLPQNPEAVAALQRARGLEEQFRQIKKRYTPAHRLWQKYKEELDLAVAHLAKFDMDLTAASDRVPKPNPKYLECEKRKDSLEKAVQGLEKKVEGFGKKRLAQNKLANELYRVKTKAPELLQRKKTLLEESDGMRASVHDYRKRLSAAEREYQRLTTEAYSTKFKVREYARVDRNPVRDTKVKIVLLAVLLGALIGAGLIVFMEYLDQTLKTVDDARECLGLPALGVIPAIFTPRDYRRRLWFRVLAVSSALFVVAVGVAVYLSVPELQRFAEVQWGNLRSSFHSW